MVEVGRRDLMVEEFKCNQKEWGQVFPQNIDDVQTSTKFVKRLLAIAISTISYVRKVLPSKSFDDKNFTGMILKLLHPKCEASNLLVSWLRGAFDAVERGYLEKLSVGIFDDVSKLNTMQEVYEFQFTYNDNSSSLTFKRFKSAAPQDMEGVIRDTMGMLVALHDSFKQLSAYEGMPFMTMKLLFTRDTPSDYQPPNFVTSAYRDYQFADDKTVDVSHRTVRTGFHSMSLSVITTQAWLRKQTPKSSAEDSAFQEETEPLEERSPTRPPSTPRLKLETADIDPEKAKNNLNCPCGVSSDNGPFMGCRRCGQYRHNVCFGYIDSEAGFISDSCHNCSPSDPLYTMCDNSTLQRYGFNDIQMCCLWRRSLLFFLMGPSFRREQLEAFIESPLCASSIFEIAVGEGIITEASSQSSPDKYLVNQRAVLAAFKVSKINLSNSVESIMTKADTRQTGSSQHVRLIMSPKTRLCDVRKRIKCVDESDKPMHVKRVKAKG